MSNEQKKVPILMDASMFYEVDENNSLIPYGEIELKEDVNVDALNKAAKEALDECPFFKNKVIREGETLYYEKNLEEFKVYKEEELKTIGSKENNNYLVAVLYSKRKIYVHIFHGITDGSGVVIYLNKLLHHYYENIGEIKKQDMSIIPEYPDPFEKIYLGEEECKQMELNSDNDNQSDEIKPFVPKFNKVVKPHYRKFYLLKFEKDKIDNFVNEKEVGASSLFALLIAKAFDSFKKDSDKDKAIVCNVVVDFRKSLENSQDLRSSVSNMDLIYDDKLKAKSLDNQLEELWDIIFEKATGKEIYSHMSGYWRFLQYLLQEGKTFEDRRKLSLGIHMKSMSDWSFALSYLGNISFGDEIDLKIQSLQYRIATQFLDYMIHCWSFKGEFYLAFSQGYINEDIAKAVLREFEKIGIEGTFIEEGEFSEKISDFANNYK